MAVDQRSTGTWLLQGIMLCLLAAGLIFAAIGSVNAQSAFGISGLTETGQQSPAADAKQKGAAGNSQAGNAQAGNSQAVDTQALAALILILENPLLRQQLLDFIKQKTPDKSLTQSTANAANAANADQDATAGQAGIDLPDMADGAAPPPELSVVQIAMGTVEGLLAKLWTFLGNAVDFSRLAAWLDVQASSEVLSGFWFDFLWVATLILVSASAVYVLTARMLRRMRFARPQDSTGPRWLRLRFLAIHTAILVVAIAAYWAVAYGLFLALQVPSRTEGVVLNLVSAVSLGLVLCTLVRFVLCPHIPSLRLFPMRDDIAIDLFRWLRRLILWIVLGRAFFENIDDLYVPSGVFEGLERLWGLAAIVYTVTLTLRYRSEITNEITAKDGRYASLRQAVSRIWMPAFFVYLIGSYVIWALDIKGASILVAQGTLLTAVILFLTQPAAFALERWLARAQTTSFGISSATVQLHLRRYAKFAGRFAKVAVYIIAAIAIAAAWELEPLSLMSEYLSGRFLHVAGEMLLILVICIGIWETADMLLAIYMEAKDNETGTLVQRSARTRTLVPLLRTILIAFLLIAFAAGTLNSLGLDIAPLLATAGIVGIAIGFGSQKLVQDVITGLFMLFQDTISIGDIVELGGTFGTVQRITVRTIELRDLEGNLHTIPFSSVDTVKNMTRDYALAVIDVGIAYRENADHVMEVLRHLGAELENDPAHGPNLLSSIEVLGVHELAESSVIIRCRFRTLPQTQFGVRRAYLALVKRRFDELGIEIPFPQRTLHWAQPHEQPPFKTETRLSADPEPEKS